MSGAISRSPYNQAARLERKALTTSPLERVKEQSSVSNTAGKYLTKQAEYRSPVLSDQSNPFGIRETGTSPVQRASNQAVTPPLILEDI